MTDRFSPLPADRAAFRLALLAAFFDGYWQAAKLREDDKKYGIVHQGNGRGGTECGLLKDPTRSPGSPKLTCPECLFARFWGA